MVVVSRYGLATDAGVKSVRASVSRPGRFRGGRSPNDSCLRGHWCVLPTLQSCSTAENDAQRSSIENWVDNDENLQSWLWSHDPSWQLLRARGAVAESVCRHDARSERESNAVGAPGESTSRFRSVFGTSGSCGAVPFDTSSVTSVCNLIATVIQCSSLLRKTWQGWRIAAVALIAASFGAHAKSSVQCSSATLALFQCLFREAHVGTLVILGIAIAIFPLFGGKRRKRSRQVP